MTTKLVILVAAVFVAAGFAFAADKHLHQGIALQQQGKIDEAIVEFEAAVEANPKDALTKCWLGSALMAAGRYADAVSHLKVAVELEPARLICHEELALALEKNGDLPGAIEQVRKVVELAPEKANWWCYLGGLLAHAERKVEAVQCLRKAAELDPKNEACLRELGVRQFETHDFAGAETSLKAAVALDPSDSYAHAWLAQVYVSQGKKEEAAAELKAADATKPSQPVEGIVKPEQPVETTKPVQSVTETPKPEQPVEATQPVQSVTETPKPEQPVETTKPVQSVTEIPKPEQPVETTKPSQPVEEIVKPNQPGNETPKYSPGLNELLPTWDPADADVTKAFVSTGPEGAYLSTEARAGYQICLTQSRLESGDFIPKSSETANALLSRGSIYVFRGKVNLWGLDFDSDSAYPLTFRVTGAGLVRLCGRGTVIAKGKTEQFGDGDSFEKWLPLAASSNAEEREAAVCALGWLAKTSAEKDTAVPVLVEALSDKSMSVRRFAAESLANLADLRGIRPLIALISESDSDKWTQSVEHESLGLLKVRAATAKLPDGMAFNVLKTCLVDKWPSVRRSAAQSLGEAGDPRATDALNKALADEKNADVKAAMEVAVGKLGK